MDEKLLDEVTQEMLHLFPLLEGKIIRVGFRSMERDWKVAPHHFMILKMLRHAGPMPVSEIGGSHDIPKSHMTYLIDRLEEMKLVERQPDTKDRRVVKVSLTPEGERTLKGCDSVMRENAHQRLSSLAEADLNQLSESLKRVREIVAKVE
jgi:DNA-binding MarR family transcriptional regulator